MFFTKKNKMDIELCKAEIKRHEGEVLEIYMDSLGYKTLGVGHLCQPNDPEYNWEVGTPVTQEVVDMYYEDDFEKHYKEAIHVFGTEEAFYLLPEVIQHVLVNMCFNLGGTRLSKFKNMLAACRKHDWAEMARQMEDSRWFGQVGRRSIELQKQVLECYST
jgi:lysozyme